MVLDQALSDIGLHIRALELPLEDLERRSHALEDALRDILAERRVAHDLLDGERRRAVAELESQAEQLRRKGYRHLAGVAQRTIVERGGVLDRSAVQHALDAAVPAFFEDRLGEVAAAFRQLVAAMVASHQSRADALAGSVRPAAAALFDTPLRTADAVEPFRPGPEPYWVTQEWRNALMPSPAGVVTRILPGQLRQGRLRRQMEAQVGALVQHSVENLRWATLRGLNETFRRLSSQLDERLREAVAVTQGVIGLALERRRTEAGQASTELQRLHAIGERLARVRAQFAEPTCP